jgi:hypothetical protein
MKSLEYDKIADANKIKEISELLHLINEHESLIKYSKMNNKGKVYFVFYNHTHYDILINNFLVFDKT